MDAVFLTGVTLFFGLLVVWLLIYCRYSLRTSTWLTIMTVCGSLWHAHVVWGFMKDSPLNFIFEFRTPLSRLLVMLMNAFTKSVYIEAEGDTLFLTQIMFPVRWLDLHGKEHLPTLAVVLLMWAAAVLATLCFLVAFIVYFPELFIVIAFILWKLDERDNRLAGMKHPYGVFAPIRHDLF